MTLFPTKPAGFVLHLWHICRWSPSRVAAQLVQVQVQVQERHVGRAGDAVDDPQDAGEALLREVGGAVDQEMGERGEDLRF